MGENIYKLPSDMNLNIKTGTVGYNNKILASDGKFSLGKNDEVNASALGPMPKISHKVVEQPTIIHSHKLSQPTITHAHKLSQPTITHTHKLSQPTIPHEDEKIALILFLTGIFVIWYAFQ